MDAFAHPAVPFEQLSEQRTSRRILSPWFQVMFILQNAHEHRLDLPGLQLTPLPVDMGVAKFDLTLSMEETDQGLVGHWEFNTQLWMESTIERMAAQYQHLLETLIQAPDVPIESLSLLSPEEHRQFHQLAIHPTESMPQLVPQRFEAIAAQQPEAPALEFDGNTWSYAQLNDWANQIAHYLGSCGVVKGDRIGVCLPVVPQPLPLSSAF